MWLTRHRRSAGYYMGTLRPEVVLFDVDFTGVDINALMSLTESGRVLLMTSLISPELAALEASMDIAQVVEKPVKLDHLLQLIQDAERRR